MSLRRAKPALLCLLLAAAAAGCAESPEDAFEVLREAALEGESAAVWERLTPEAKATVAGYAREFHAGESEDAQAPAPSAEGTGAGGAQPAESAASAGSPVGASQEGREGAEGSQSGQIPAPAGEGTPAAGAETGELQAPARSLAAASQEGREGAEGSQSGQTPAPAGEGTPAAAEAGELRESAGTPVAAPAQGPPPTEEGTPAAGAEIAAYTADSAGTRRFFSDLLDGLDPAGLDYLRSLRVAEIDHEDGTARLRLASLRYGPPPQRLIFVRAGGRWLWDARNVFTWYMRERGFPAPGE